MDTLNVNQSGSAELHFARAYREMLHWLRRRSLSNITGEQEKEEGKSIPWLASNGITITKRSTVRAHEKEIQVQLALIIAG